MHRLNEDAIGQLTTDREPGITDLADERRGVAEQPHHLLLAQTNLPKPLVVPFRQLANPGVGADL